MTTSEPRPLKDWEAEHADRVVWAINALRERYGWTIPRLRNELEPFGWSPSIETLNGILSAKKRKAFTVGEIFAFARALKVSPAYLTTGLPLGVPLPEGPVLPENDVTSTFTWITDAELHILDGSALGPFVKYADAMNYAKWHNALWVVSGDRALGAAGLVQALRDIAFWRKAWGDYAQQSFNVPEIPPLPPELQQLGVDEWEDDYNPRYHDAPGSAPEFNYVVEPLGESFSGPAWIATAQSYIERHDAIRAELRKLESRGQHGAPADAAE